MTVTETGFAKRIEKRRPAPADIGSWKPTLTDLGVLDRLYNMECPNGHRSYSPMSDFWLGSICGARQQPGVGSCRELLVARVPSTTDLPE